MVFNLFINKKVLAVSAICTVVLCSLIYYSFYKPAAVKNIKNETKSLLLKNRIIVLDPGHGGADPGAMVGEIKESDLNMQLAIELKKQLEANGAVVKLTRNWDKGIVAQKRMKYSERARILNIRRMFAAKEKGNLLISIHVNSSTDESVSGSWIYYSDKVSKKLAKCIQKRFNLMESNEKRRVHLGNYKIIRNNIMPSILVEAGFMTNSDDLEMIKNKTEIIAKPIRLGICDYTNATKSSSKYEMEAEP